MQNYVCKTPLLVPIPASFDEYLENATKRCRYEQKNAPDIKYEEIEFDRTIVKYWMELWEKQPIATGFPKWRRYTPDRFEKLANMDILHVFWAGEGLQMVEKCDNYVYAHPPLYEKTNPIAKSMWFGLIRWCCGRLDWLDMGGGQQKRWNELERKGYKWLYVPKNLHREPWRVQICACGWRQLIYEPYPCHGCSRR